MAFPIQCTHTLLDAARMLDRINKAKELNLQHVSLYRGQSEEVLANVAPYLFTYQEGMAFANWLAEGGWGEFWGIYFYSEASFADLHRHFRKFLLVQTEDGEELYFRFYDPRVLRVFLPTCDEGQLRDFFGPVNYFMMEDEDPSQAIVFFFNKQEGKLGSYTVPVERSNAAYTEDNVTASE